MVVELVGLDCCHAGVCVCVSQNVCNRGGAWWCCVYFILCLHVVSVFEGVDSVFLRVWVYVWACWRECGGLCE